MNKVCPNHCHATDKPILRCPRCGEMMKETGMSEKEIMDATRDRQVANRSQFLTDTQRLSNSQLTEEKEYYADEERRYFNSLRK